MSTEQHARAVLRKPAEREILTEREFASSPERVWRAFTDPESVARWWGSSDSTTRIEQLDLRPGGQWRFVEVKPDGREIGFRGVYREVSRPRRLVYTFECELDPGRVLIGTVDFVDLGAGRTRLVAHSLFHAAEERDAMIEVGMEKGLNDGYAVLDALLAEGAA